MKKLAVGWTGLVLAFTPALLAQQQTGQADRNSETNMQRAIQFENLKNSEDARQAAIEKVHPTVTEPGPNGSADRLETESLPGRPVLDTGPGPQTTAAQVPAYPTTPTRKELARALRWEHQKDAAAAQQAKQANEADRSSDHHQ